MKKVLSDLHQDYVLSMKLYFDNKVAISIANNPIQHDRTKHVEIDKHLIKEKLNNDNIYISYIPLFNKLLTFSPKGY